MFELYFDDIFLLIWIGFMAYIGKSSVKQKVTVLGHEEERYSWMIAIIAFFPIFRLAVYGANRGDVGTYVANYLLTNMSMNEVFDNWNNLDKGPGFILIEMITKNFFGNNSVAFKFVVALFHSLPLIYIYRKYSVDYILSIFLFTASLSYDGWMMNGIRQFIAVTIIFAAFPLFLQKKYIKLALVILLATTVHSSAVVMFAVFAAVGFEPWKKRTLFILLVFTSALVIYLMNTSYMSEEYSQYDDGANPIRVLFALIPTVIAFWGRKQIAEKDNYMINVCINISIITALIYAVAVFTSGVTVGRLPGYTSIYNFLLIPYLCSEVFDEKKSKKIRTFFIWLYIAYFFADLMFI